MKSSGTSLPSVTEAHQFACDSGQHQAAQFESLITYASWSMLTRSRVEGIAMPQ